MFTRGSVLLLVAEITSSNGHPIDPKVVLPVANGFGITVIGAALLITTVIALFACTCCKQRRDGFKPKVEEVVCKEEFRNPPGGSQLDFTNRLSSELAIFPPPNTEPRSPLEPGPASSQQSPGFKVPSRPAAFSCAIPSITDWFVDQNGNFPRQQLFYQKEIGKGWFGKVVKGEARGAKVIVRILREDATPEEKGYFLHEAKPFRDLKHRNIARLYGRCLEHDPFLLLFEYCTNGDLKSFLVTNSNSRNAITEQKISLKMMIDVTEGLKFMNEHGFIHTDLAARNCLIASDLTVKIGDYGTSVDKYKNEYYIVGDVAIPIRWCAPESLTCTDTTIETKEVTESGNVWSLAVLLWEIAEFGKLPYQDMSDEEVIIRVLQQAAVRLPPPNCSFGHYLHNIMALCWRRENRANIEQVFSMLIYLKSNPFQESDFETRWRMLKPNTIAVVDNHTPIHSPRHTELAQRPHLTAKHEFDSGVDLEIKPTDENPDSYRTSTPNTVSPQLSVTSEEIFQPTQHKSPSLTNLKGSLEDVAQFDSWLMGVEQKTEEDRKFVKNISEAIKNLDETLAMEKTSSSSQDSSMEGGSKKPLLDFKLGPTESEKKGDSSSSDTEEETWRNRIERGEFTEKVKEKSKSVTDLMVLTHIDSEGSESDSLPSLTRQYSLKKTTVKGVSYTGVGFGSEGNIRNAVLSEELQDKLKQLTSWKTDTQSFLVKGASEKNNKNIYISGDKKLSNVSKMEVDKYLVNNSVLPVNKVSVMKEEKIVNSDCTKYSPLQNEFSVIANTRSSDNNEDLPSLECFSLSADNNLLVSSHEKSVPKIVITESELSQGFDEAEPSVDTQFLVEFKPRKFVLVCKDLDTPPEKEELQQCCDVKSEKEVLEENSSSDVVKSSEKNSEPQQETSLVILGSCEEHTLEYFKGLKTTFTPEVSFSPDYAESGVVDTFEPVKDGTCINEGKFLENFAKTSNSENTRFISNLNDRNHSSTHEGTNIDEEKLANQYSDCDAVEDSQMCESITDETHSTTESGSSKFIDSVNMKEINDVFLVSERSHTNITYPSTSSLSNTFEDNLISTGSVKSYEDGMLRRQDVADTLLIDSLESSGNSSEEHLVEAPFPFNQPESSDVQPNICNVKAKSLDSFLSPKNGFEHFVTLRNGIYLEDDSVIPNFVPVFNMTESVSENTFMSQNLYYDPYFSVDSGHSSDRCVEQDKKMNDLKNRLEDVVKAGNDFQLKNSEEEYGGKLLTPDDERSSDSGFRDKGSLSESVEDTCDEKYNLEDIDAELDEYTIKNIEKEDLKYYEQFVEPDQEAMPGWFLQMRPEAALSEQKGIGWLSQSTEDEERLPLTIDDEFAAAIRNELKEKLPGVQQVEKVDEDTSPEQELVTEKFTYPSQLSPILEEQESNHSSLQLNESSPIFLLPPPEIKTDTFKEDIVKAFEELESTKNGIVMEDLEGDNELVIFNEDRIVVDDDVLIVNTETNEATLIESPKPHSHLAFILSKKDSEPYVSDDSPEMNSDMYAITPDNAPLTPNSVNTDSHSSLENANMSGLFLSPCSIRSDLFDSGPPSLPFDLGQSLEEVEDIPIFRTASSETLVEKSPEIAVRESNSDIFEKPSTDDKNNEIADLEKSANEMRIFKPIVENDAVGSIDHGNTVIDDKEKPGEISTLRENNSTCGIKVTVNPSSPLNSEVSKDLQNEQNSKHFKAEVEIDRLISSCNKLTKIDNVNEKNTISISAKNDWLKELIFTNGVSDCEVIKQNENKKYISCNLSKSEWPTIDELIHDGTEKVSEQNNNLKPSYINSTLALLSPDASSGSGDSKSLTPSTDESRSVVAKPPSTLNLQTIAIQHPSAGGLLSPDGSSVSLTPSSDESKSNGTKPPNSLGLAPTSAVQQTAPMPSPEDAEKGWRPTICQLMELSEQAAADGEEMTTSFIEPDENGIYTPDWESDISEEQSSSSGEFVWKEGDKEDLIKCVSTDTNSLMDDFGGQMERIDEEDEECSSCCSDGSSTGSSGAEFVPSTWNAMAVPLKPSLRPTTNSQKKSEQKKVIFKKEKYQCIYEYPREESDNEEEEYNPGIWQTPNTPAFDYSVFADWELGEGEMTTPIDGLDSDNEDNKKSNSKETEYDFYRLDYNPGSQLEKTWTADQVPEDDSEFSPLAADLGCASTARLGDLRHTKGSLRLELPQLRPDKGEASILDGGSP